MSLKDLEIKNEYRSKITDVVSSFFVPVLSESCSYKRSVGFFSSSSLIEISKGICSLARRGGKIKLVTSPCLSDEDIEAIKTGYKNRDEVIKNALIRELKEPNNELESDRLALLAYLITIGTLDIKVAVVDNGIGIYHEKLGLMEDWDDNIVAFSGSMNESETAIRKNYEAIDVFCSWNDKDVDRVREKKQAFDAIWNGYESGIEVLEFPEVSDEIIKRYKRNIAPEFSIDENEYGDAVANYKKLGLGARIPQEYNPLRDYQEKAIKNWAKNGYKGIFDMATGTGKTLTALGAISKLSESLNDNLGVIIVCPYQHLVDQWVEDIEKFNMKPIIGYSNSPQKNWKNKLRLTVQSYINDVEKFFCFICTNATFSTSYVQNELGKIKKSMLLVVDEAHNFGATKISRTLTDNYDYRLALSATFDRHMDESGTSLLYNYFGDKAIEYSLERAIKENMLTPYYYHPIIILLSDVELNQYRELSEKIKKEIRISNSKEVYLSEKGKMLTLKRARLVAGATAKIPALKNVLQDYKDKRNILVYCGATSYISDDLDVLPTDESDIRQIDVVRKMMFAELGIKTAKFTSEETIEERTQIKERFIDKDGIQAIVAIKCLDEGVNIPGIKTALILASTTNPKEYIQRRGRVLRKAPGKEYAEIYDFITLPRPLSEASNIPKSEIIYDVSLIRRELLRVKEFGRLALNEMQSLKLITEIENTYEDYDFSDETIDEL